MYLENVLRKLEYDRYNYVLVLIIICFASYIIYGESLYYGIVNYDDHIYINYINKLFSDGVNYSDLISIFSDYVNANWHPITILSLVIDYIVSNNSATYFHFINIIIHISNAMLIYYIFKKISNNNFSSILTALIFTVHPLNVETVVWISERKGLLSVLFALGSVVFYLNSKTEKSRINRYLSLFLFLLSLLSKPTTATIPAVLVLMDLTILNKDSKINFKMIINSITDKALYFVVGAGVVVVSFLAQSDHGALRDLSAVTLSQRFEASINNIFIYISKIFVPVNLASYYPQPEKSYYILFLYVLFILSWVGIAIKYFSKYKLITFCIFFFFIQILPMSGLFQTGSHSIANRYTYLPAVGMFFIISFMISKIQNRKIYIPIIILLITTLIVMSSSQTKIWKSDLDLWKNTIENTEQNYRAAYFYSSFLLDAGRVKEAVNNFYNILGIKNLYYSNMAISKFSEELINRKHFAEAKVILDKALQVGFRYKNIYRELALLEYFIFNKKNIGYKYIKAVLKSSPDDIRANKFYANMLIDKKEYELALEVLYKIKNLNPVDNETDLNIKIIEGKVNSGLN